MSVNKSKVNLNIGGNHLPFVVPEAHEPLYRKAEEMINKQMAKLQNQYGDRAKAEELQGIIAVEALVDAIQAQENYEKLQKEITSQVDQLAAKLL
ncbi:Cell division protein ZapA [Spirosomataceae bacterium TFI 002]|nr:Cell division protein ZapA [Spirosomataceae bacterium TFI 002]